jgi:hypothetical protein
MGKGHTLGAVPEAVVVAQVVLRGKLCENAAMHDLTLWFWKEEGTIDRVVTT